MLGCQGGYDFGHRPPFSYIEKALASESEIGDQL
ncbi:MAG: hypothetical protein HW396_1718 [Candidatus Dadabacteria bacterium]|nr:hypothetical protein [Candidatus Dadabacteria bacterium]